MPMEIGGQPGEFLVLEYAGRRPHLRAGAALHLVSRYTGAAPEQAPLHKLGTDQWARARRRAAEQMRDVAAELLDLYARRKARAGLRAAGRRARVPGLRQRASRSRRPPTRREAIAHVLADLAQRTADGSRRLRRRRLRQDRGRACAPPSSPCRRGKQVAVLVPTTLLAQQHLPDFRDRFADWPVRIEALSRFRTAQETAGGARGPRAAARSTSSSPRTGCCTRRRASRTSASSSSTRNIASACATRSGCKALRAEVDVLTLTATPIPRTLNMALGGLRDLSLITTPPAGRLAIKTFVTEWHAPTLREACAARAAPRRPDLLRAQRGAHHREDRRGARRRWCRRPRCASATARCASATSSS